MIFVKVIVVVSIIRKKCVIVIVSIDILYIIHFSSIVPSSDYNWLPNYPPAYMQNFFLTSSIDIQHLILTAQSIFPTDVLPLFDTKILADQLCIIFKDIINISISTGDIPPNLNTQL